jgi:hypothetical protein
MISADAQRRRLVFFAFCFFRINDDLERKRSVGT